MERFWPGASPGGANLRERRYTTQYLEYFPSRPGPSGIESIPYLVFEVEHRLGAPDPRPVAPYPHGAPHLRLVHKLFQQVEGSHHGPLAPGGRQR